MPLRAYLDTCIVSGLAKGDLAEGDTSALLRVLRAYKAGELELVTSEVTAVEIGAIPESYRQRHEVIYNLIADVPSAPTHRTDSGLTLMGVGGGTREDPLFAQLRSTLPDSGDAAHVFQAARSGATVLITVDRRSFISHAEAIANICGVQVVPPTEFGHTYLPASQ